MSSPKRLSGPMMWLTWSALGVLAILVAVGLLGAAASAGELAAFLPVLAPVQGPLIMVAIAFGLCIEALILMTGVLVGYIRVDRIFSPSALRLVDGLVVAVVIATLLVIVALFFIPGPPQLFLLVEAAVPVGATIALVLLVMRSLLRRAVAMHVELDEVV
ncbi:DUF2975 domain-containing protein [Cryobacterium zhongshanensis]|uniref:DUF2975 domain-containing protein n=1 Tax=Cryobacterium zhongshanensis TaxID=2928153 RepID=A0AA41QWC4_9MICO|nr:DUF2975 domain-containing protein [Cryobacterium zhongshanensis]MCI4658922.1 DUF2975 domain-containing protein [Cryobacterium zhongshanensis]